MRYMWQARKQTGGRVAEVRLVGGNGADELVSR